jgi:hypothetical protein
MKTSPVFSMAQLLLLLNLKLFWVLDVGPSVPVVSLNVTRHRFNWSPLYPAFPAKCKAFTYRVLASPTHLKPYLCVQQHLLFALAFPVRFGLSYLLSSLTS